LFDIIFLTLISLNLIIIKEKSIIKLLLKFIKNIKINIWLMSTVEKITELLRYKIQLETMKLTDSLTNLTDELIYHIKNEINEIMSSEHIEISNNENIRENNEHLTPFTNSSDDEHNVNLMPNEECLFIDRPTNENSTQQSLPDNYYTSITDSSDDEHIINASTNEENLSTEQSNNENSTQHINIECNRQTTNTTEDEIAAPLRGIYNYIIDDIQPLNSSISVIPVPPQLNVNNTSVSCPLNIINSFPCFLSKKDSSDKCAICFNSYTKNENLCNIGCHLFHFNCITEWLKQSCYCPICKSDLRELWKD
jgi:hypothetical protein